MVFIELKKKKKKPFLDLDVYIIFLGKKVQKI